MTTPSFRYSPFCQTPVRVWCVDHPPPFPLSCPDVFPVMGKEGTDRTGVGGWGLLGVESPCLGTGITFRDGITPWGVSYVCPSHVRTGTWVEIRRISPRFSGIVLVPPQFYV